MKGRGCVMKIAGKKIPRGNVLLFLVLPPSPLSFTDRICDPCREGEPSEQVHRCIRVIRKDSVSAAGMV